MPPRVPGQGDDGAEGGEPADHETSSFDRCGGVAAAVTAAAEPWPDGGVEGFLDAASAGGGGLDVFEEAQLAAGFEDAADLG
jgi:hypothetical protein